MSYRELTMNETKEVLRRWKARQSKREIARGTGLDRKTVRRYIEAAEVCGLSRDSELSDSEVQAVTQRVQDRPAPEPSEQRELLLRHKDLIDTWLKSDKPLRLSKVLILLKRQSVEVSYPTLRRFAINELGWRLPAATVRVDDPEPGQEAQADFGCMGVMYDPETGRVRKLWALVVILTVSRYMFVWPTFKQTVEALCEGLDAAWRFFGGVPYTLVFDNPKTIVVKADPTAPKLNQSFLEYAQQRGIFVDPARVRHPKDKPRVENQVAFVRENWFAGEQFVNVKEARESAEYWCREIAGARIHGTTLKVPRQFYEEVEKPHMQPAPEERFDVPLWTEAKVHPDHHIQVQRALYSIPHAYLGRTVRVRSDSRIVRVYLNAELIKTHPRVGPGQRSTDPNDYPPGKADYALRNVSALIERARKHGLYIGQYAERLLDLPLPWVKMRQGYQLLRLCDKYGQQRVDATCRRALDFDVVDVPRIARMLKDAVRIEDEAEQNGKLKRLPTTLRFARGKDLFRTLGPQGGER
jgi:transposase